MMDDIQRTIEFLQDEIAWLEEQKNNKDTVLAEVYKEINGDERKQFMETAISAMQELQQYREMETKGLIVKMPCAVGDTVYEVLHDDIPVPVDYIAKYPVEDVSVKGIRYAGDWFGWDELRDTYFSKEEAEKRLRELAAGGKV